MSSPFVFSARVSVAFHGVSRCSRVMKEERGLILAERGRRSGNAWHQELANSQRTDIAFPAFRPQILYQCSYFSAWARISSVPRRCYRKRFIPSRFSSSVFLPLTPRLVRKAKTMRVKLLMYRINIKWYAEQWRGGVLTNPAPPKVILLAI